MLSEDIVSSGKAFSVVKRTSAGPSPLEAGVVPAVQSAAIKTCDGNRKCFCDFAEDSSEFGALRLPYIQSRFAMVQIGAFVALVNIEADDVAGRSRGPLKPRDVALRCPLPVLVRPLHDVGRLVAINSLFGGSEVETASPAQALTANRKLQIRNVIGGKGPLASPRPRSGRFAPAARRTMTGAVQLLTRGTTAELSA